jgi:hypothetical protein
MVINFKGSKNLLLFSFFWILKVKYIQILNSSVFIFDDFIFVHGVYDLSGKEAGSEASLLRGRWKILRFFRLKQQPVFQWFQFEKIQ